MKQLTESISKTNEKFNNLSKYFKPKEEGEDPELDKLCKELEKVDITDDKALEKGLDIIKSLTNTAVDAAKESTEAVQETMQAIKEQEEIPVAQRESPIVAIQVTHSSTVAACQVGRISVLPGVSPHYFIGRATIECQRKESYV